MEGFERTLGKPGFHHYLLLDTGRPIAVAALVKFGEIGYLTYAGTVERERRRGAQSALIAHRVAAAQSMGCTHIVSQTLTMLEDSFANLQRCGFREVYEQEVFEYVRSGKRDAPFRGASPFASKWGVSPFLPSEVAGGRGRH